MLLLLSVTTPALGGSRATASHPDATCSPVPHHGFASPNVEHVCHLAEVAPSASTVVGDRLYLTNEKSLYIYDVEDPLEPQRIGVWDSNSVHPWVANGSPATNGRLLLFAQTPARTDVGWGPGGPSVLTILDVTEPGAPEELASLTLPSTEGVWTCLLDCTWAYGAWSGFIVDLRDPTAPKLLDRRWTEGLPIEVAFRQACTRQGGACLQDAHDVDEVRPGLALTGTKPMFLLDVRNPARPRVLHLSDGSPYSWGGIQWPLAGRSRFALSFNMGGVYFGARCEARRVLANGTFEFAFVTWDTRPWRDDGFARVVDKYYLENGYYADGDPAISGTTAASGCQPGWFEVHPDYAATGLVGITSPGHGVKFVHISGRGGIDEVGYFLPDGGNVYDGEWIGDDIFYSIDLYRGIDILRFKQGGA